MNFQFNWSKLTIWQRIRLYFKPMHMSIDLAESSRDKSCMVTYKVVDDITVIQSIEYFNQGN